MKWIELFPHYALVIMVITPMKIMSARNVLHFIAKNVTRKENVFSVKMKAFLLLFVEVLLSKKRSNQYLKSKWLSKRVKSHVWPVISSKKANVFNVSLEKIEIHLLTVDVSKDTMTITEPVFYVKNVLSFAKNGKKNYIIFYFHLNIYFINIWYKCLVI